MSDSNAERSVREGTHRGHKSYAFDEDHDSSIPALWWFQESLDGDVLFLVFYSLACRWSQCLGCNLPAAMSGHHVDYRQLMRQVDHVCGLEAILKRRATVAKVILSNNGSVLDEATFSTTALVYLLAKLNMTFPAMRVVSIETRAEYVDLVELEVLQRVLREGEVATDLEIAIGVEAFDDKIRNAVFRKGLPRDGIDTLVRRIAPFGYMLKCYFMLKPVPNMTDADAVADIHRGIDYLSALAGGHGVRINMHLNPTYVARGTMLEEHFTRGEYRPPSLVDLAKAARRGRDKDISLYLGLNDEGMAVEGGSFLKEGDEDLVAALEHFNRTGDYDILDAVAES